MFRSWILGPRVGKVSDHQLVSFSFIPFHVPCFLAIIKTPFFALVYLLFLPLSSTSKFWLELFLRFSSAPICCIFSLWRYSLLSAYVWRTRLSPIFWKDVFAVSPWHLLSSLDLGLYIFVISSLQLCRSSLVVFNFADLLFQMFLGLLQVPSGMVLGGLSLSLSISVSFFLSFHLSFLFVSRSLSRYIYIYIHTYSLSLDLPLVFFFVEDWVLRVVSLFVFICLQTLHLFSSW